MGSSVSYLTTAGIQLILGFFNY